MRLVALVLAVWLAVLPLRAASAQPIGGPFQINAFTVGDQSEPALAAAAAGGFVVVWQSVAQDGDYLGIVARRYTSSGVAAGAEFQVNAYTVGPQAAPAIGMAADGSFLVAWQGYGEGGDYGDIFARRFTSAGTAAGPEFQVNDPAPAYEGAAAVAAAGGGFVVVWDDYYDVFARRFDSAGSALGTEFAVNTVTAGVQWSAAVAATAGGGFVVVWEDGDYPGGRDGDGYGVFGQRFTANGMRVGSEFQVNTSTIGNQADCAVTATADGGFVVVWRSYDSIQPVPDPGIFGRRFDSLGSPAGSEFRVDPAGSGEAGAPRAAADHDGNFVVVWAGVSGVGPAVLAQPYDASGAALAGPLTVDGGGTGTPGQPAVAAVPDGRHVVVWRRQAGDGDEGAVLGQRYAAIQVTRSLTATGTTTATTTATATASHSATPSPTAPRTETHTPTRTGTPTASSTATRTAILPATRTATPTPTASATPTRSALPTATSTPTVTETVPPTSTRSATFTAPPTRTATPTRSTTPPSSPTATPSASPSGTRTAPPSASATETPSSAATHTATASLPPPSMTKTPSAGPTVSATAAVRCAGDCDADRQVTVSELITAVGFSLSDQPPTNCPAIDGNGDGHATIDELVLAVTAALNGCPTGSDL